MHILRLRNCFLTIFWSIPFPNPCTLTQIYGLTFDYHSFVLCICVHNWKSTRINIFVTHPEILKFFFCLVLNARIMYRYKTLILFPLHAMNPLSIFRIFFFIFSFWQKSSCKYHVFSFFPFHFNSVCSNIYTYIGGRLKITKVEKHNLLMLNK